MSKIRDVICKTYTYVCIWKISIFSNANVTDALSSNNGVGCKWGEEGGKGTRRLFSYTAKNIGESTLWKHVRVRGDELLLSKLTMGDRSVVFCRWQ